jgi:hypothetical protein
MSISKEEIKQYLLENVEIKTKTLNESGMSREGAVNVDDYMNSVREDLQGEMITQQISAGDFMPYILDPSIYDNGVLYGMTPALTYLESKGRRKPAESTKLDYNIITSGFAGEWIEETADTAGTGASSSTLTHATMKYLALPFSASDILGKGASAQSRRELENFALMSLREEFDQTVVAGDASGTQEFDGLFEIAKDSGNRTNMSNTEITEDDVEGLEVIMNDTLKTYPTFILTSASVLRQLKKDLAAQSRVMDKTNAVLGLSLPAYASNRGEIPIVVDPYVPKTATTRHLGMFNENFINIADLLTPSFIPEGRALPFASSGWFAQVAVQYHTYPAGVAELYGIA